MSKLAELKSKWLKNKKVKKVYIEQGHEFSFMQKKLERMATLNQLLREIGPQLPSINK